MDLFSGNLHLIFNLLILFVSFYILSKSADFLVDGAVGVAYKLNISKIVIGIVLVGFATTAPEFAVSMLSAIKGFPEIALGNAVGSVIVDDAVALSLGILVAPKVIKIDSRILKFAGLFLITIDFLAFGLALNGVISRYEGIILLFILCFYISALLVNEKKNRTKNENMKQDEEIESHIHEGSLFVQFGRFLAGLSGVLFASHFLLESSINVAEFFKVPKAIIGLTIIAIGTSLPEIFTCISAAKKGHGDLAFGDIIGADILNILWIVGAASVANPITVDKVMLYGAFPIMILVVILMLGLAKIGNRLNKWNAYVLLTVYAFYLAFTIIMYYLPSNIQV